MNFEAGTFIGRVILRVATINHHVQHVLAAAGTSLKTALACMVNYPHKSKRYQPDFYLTDYDIWIEHFGIDKKGNTAPYIDREKYHCEMESECETRIIY